MRICFILLAIAFVACNSEPKDRFAKKEKTQVDILMDSVNEGHIGPMGKMGKLTRYQKRAEAIIDSLDKLIALGKVENKPLFAETDSVLKMLDYANVSMTKWMNEWNMDSMKNDEAAQLEYLRHENLKVRNMGEAMDRGLQRADSLFMKLSR